MAAVNKKLDLLLGVMLPTHMGAGASSREATAATTTHTSGPPVPTDSNISGDKRNAEHVTSATQAGWCSPSGTSEMAYRAFQPGSLPGFHIHHGLDTCSVYRNQLI